MELMERIAKCLSYLEKEGKIDLAGFSDDDIDKIGEQVHYELDGYDIDNKYICDTISLKVAEMKARNISPEAKRQETISAVTKQIDIACGIITENKLIISVQEDKALCRSILNLCLLIKFVEEV